MAAEDYRIGPAVIYVADDITDPLSDWTEVTQTRGNVVVTPTASELARGRTDQTGAAPLSEAVWTSPREVMATIPMAQRDLDAMARVFPGSVKVTNSAKKTLNLPPTISTISTRAFAVVPIDEHTDGEPHWDSQHAFWWKEAYLLVTELAAGTEVSDDEDALSNTVFEVEIRRAVPNASGYGPIWVDGQGVEGLDFVYEPDIERTDGTGILDAALKEGGGTFTRSSTATYIDGNGVVQSVGVDTPRPQDGGLLVEPQRTNEVTHSEDLTNASWTKTNATISADAQTAPDGNTTSDKIVEDSSTGVQHGVEQSVSASADADQAISFFGRADGRDWGYIETQDSGGNTHRTWFDLNNGTVGTVAAEHSDAEIDTTDNGHFRCMLVATPASGESINNKGFFTATGDGSATHDGDGSSGIDGWGFQREDGASFVTSYIPTSGSAVTRSVDTLTFPYTKNFDASAGLTVQTQFDPIYSGMNTFMTWGVGGEPGAGGKRIGFIVSGNGEIVRATVDDGTNSPTINLGGISSHSAGDDYTVQFDGGTLEGLKNDSSAGTDSSASISDGDSYEQEEISINQIGIVLKRLAVARGVHPPSVMRTLARS